MGSIKQICERSKCFQSLLPAPKILALNDWMGTRDRGGGVIRWDGNHATHRNGPRFFAGFLLNAVGMEVAPRQKGGNQNKNYICSYLGCKLALARWTRAERRRLYRQAPRVRSPSSSGALLCVTTPVLAWVTSPPCSPAAWESIDLSCTRTVLTTCSLRHCSDLWV